MAGYIIAKWQKISTLVLLDPCMPSVILGQAIGRWGNFFNREAFGKYTDNLVAMKVRADQAKDGFSKVAIDSEGYIQVHPTFLYEPVLNLALMFVLIKVIRPRAKFQGEIICWYVLGYGIIRSFIEGLRVGQLLLFSTGIPVSQLLAVGVVTIVIIVER